MTDERKLELLEEILDLPGGTLRPETVLAGLPGWDSVAILSFIALVEDEFGKTLRGAEVRGMKTAAHLMAAMEPAR